MKMPWKPLALLSGLALFGWYLSRADLRAVGETLGRLGWLAPTILVPYIFVYLLDCLGWRFSFPPGTNVSFATLFRIRWSGESVNNVLPSAYVGGEAVKVHLLRRHGLAAQTGLGAAVVSKSAQSIAQLVFILLAAIAFLRLAGDQPGLQAGMLLVLVGGGLVLAGLFWMQRRGLFGSLLALAQAVHANFGFLEKRRAKILEADQAIASYYRNHRARFCAATAIYLGGWLSDTLEIYLVARLLELPIAWKQALAVEAFTSVAKVLGLWVPGALGVQESSIVLLGRLAGLPDPLSATYALLRRAREILFALVGWLLLCGQQTSLRSIRTAVEPVAKGRK